MFRREPLSRNLLRRPVVAPRFSIGPCRALNFHKHPMCIIRDDCLTTRIATDLAFKADKRSEARLIEGTRHLRGMTDGVGDWPTRSGFSFPRPGSRLDEHRAGRVCPANARAFAETSPAASLTTLC